MVNNMHDLLSDTYKMTRCKSVGAEWPPSQPKVIVSVALIHYNGRKTAEELFQTASRHKEGAAAVDKIILSYESHSAKRPQVNHSRITKHVTDIFAPDPKTNELPTRILIEGAPGIGKTVLTKEIAFCWANNELLRDVKILFLLFLRDPLLQKVEGFRQLIQYVSRGSLTDQQIDVFISQINPVKLGFVLDGFDEYPSSLQRRSYIVSIINGEVFPNSTVVITSRPTATISLHGRVDRRIDILGFAKEEREEYISQSLDKEKKEELDKYLIKKPTINVLCFIPLHLAILLYLFQQGSLPETLTEMNESFILHTIYRHLERHELKPSGVVDKLDKVPKPIVEIVYRLSELAYKGLHENKLVFTLDEVQKICPNIMNITEAINGFGLLQAVEHYPRKGAGTTTSLNFLHYTMQEYLGALHVSTLLSSNQLSLMEKTFWDDHFSFMWMMYVGIVGAKSEAFINFISKGEQNKGKGKLIVSNRIIGDKRKRLHLFQCFMEAKSITDTPDVITSMFKDGNVEIDRVKLVPHHISSLTLFISSFSINWKVLQLRHCNIEDIGMNVLEQFACEAIKIMPTLEYFDLSENISSPWGVYCAIIRHCSSNSLTLCGDDGMEEHVGEIINSLQVNTNLQSLALFNVGVNGMNSLLTILNNITTLTKVRLSWTVLSSEEIVQFLREITNKHCFQEIDLAHNNVTKLGFINVKCCIKDLLLAFPIRVSWNEIITDKDGKTTLKSINCTLYKNFDNDSDDIKEYIWTPKKTFSDVGIILLCECIKEDDTLQELNIPYHDISSEGAKKIVEAIKVNRNLQKLYISNNKIFNDGAEAISDYLKNDDSLLELNVSDNGITNYGVQKIAEAIKVNKRLQKLDNYKNRVSSDGAAAISDCLKSNKSLLELNISDNGIQNDGAIRIAEAMKLNTTLQKLDICKNRITDDGIVAISDCLKNNNSLQVLIIPDYGMTSKGAESIAEAIKVNTSLNTLSIRQHRVNKDKLSFNMILLTALHHNNSLITLNLPNISVDERVIIASEVEKINKERIRQDISTLTCDY